MSAVVRAVVVASFFVLMVLSGIWLSRTGRPLNVGISAVHKLVSVAAGVFLLATVVQSGRAASLTGPQWFAVVATGICFLVMVATGGLLSSAKPVPGAVLRAHQVMPALTVLSSGTMLYLLLGR